MKIEVKGRNFAVTDELRERIEKRFEKVGKQVSDLATLEIELSEERNPSIREKCVAEATLHLKGVTLRAKDASESMAHTVNLSPTSSRGRSSATATSAAGGANPRASNPVPAES